MNDQVAAGVLNTAVFVCPDTINAFNACDAVTAYVTVPVIKSDTFKEPVI